MAPYTYKGLKAYARKVIDRMEFGDIVRDDFLLKTLAFHPQWEKKVMNNGVQREIRKDKWFNDCILHVLNQDGTVFDDISWNIACMARGGRKLPKLDERSKPVYDPNYYKKK